MSKIEKLIAKIENYKSGNKIEFSDLEKYLKYSGFKKKKQNGTSHVIFTHDLLDRPFPIPKHGNSVKEVYVKKAVELVEEINYRKEERKYGLCNESISYAFGKWKNRMVC